ncbi:ROK family transcriptional regulator [Jannaschia formosa]|uniref:ROK family transcriptional regulator n=1 Tax=Jannaschia formosa TaxID=2259592 RepID=UPI000E1BC9E6|nr:ROK family transcriptional regulator [Jannaschia formosa]TFL16110.1 ROK family transcriptional regulator [Jannaschia formosa]
MRDSPERLAEASDQRRQGRARVLAAIRRAGAIARVDIARETGISAATVTALTAELLAEGLIERIEPEGRAGAMRRGRPREALKVRGAARLMAGAKVSHRVITVLLVDFEGAEIGAHEVRRSEIASTPEALADAIVAATAAACAAHGRALSELSGLCVGLAGHVDGGRGHVHWSSALDRRSVDFAPVLATRAPCPVFLENDANLVAKAEQLFGRGRGVADFLVVTIQHGIGLGLVVDGRLHRGARGCSGEFGHTKVTAGGALCQCGQRGCLEAYAGGYGLSARAAEAGLPGLDLDGVSAAEAAGDPTVCRILSEARGYFATGLANLVTVFDPELVILAVETEGTHPLCTPEVLEEVRRLSLSVDAPPTEIIVHAWGDRMWAEGAAAYAIERVEALAVERRPLGQSA